MANAAREYAKALYTSLENTEKKSQVLNWMRSFSSSLEQDPQFLEQVRSKSLKDSDTKKILDELVAQSPEKDILKNFFYLLVDKNRLGLIQEITEQLQNSMDEENNVVRGVVKSALQLDNEQKKELEERFSKKLNKKVLLTYEKDKDVVAGIRVHVGAYTFDDTVERHIKNIKENLNRSWN